MTSPAAHPGLEGMLDRLASKESAHFKHQTRDEPDLTKPQKVEIARQIFAKSPAQFLARFHAHLDAQDCACFDGARGDYEVEFYLKEIAGRKVGQRVKNRRFRAMQRLMEAGDYFSVPAMRERDPLLFEQLVGRFSTPEELSEMLPLTYASFSGFLLSSIDRKVHNAHQKLQEELESNQLEEEDDDEEEEEEEDDTRPEKISDEHRALLREEFLSIMQDRFVRGEDRDFDYAVLDADQTLDDHKERDLDCEERYFDDEDSASAHTLSAASSHNFIHRTGLQGDAECDSKSVGSGTEMDCDKGIGKAEECDVHVNE